MSHSPGWGQRTVCGEPGPVCWAPGAPICFMPTHKGTAGGQAAVRTDPRNLGLCKSGCCHCVAPPAPMHTHAHIHTAIPSLPGLGLNCLQTRPRTHRGRINSELDPQTGRSRRTLLSPLSPGLRAVPQWRWALSGACVGVAGSREQDWALLPGHWLAWHPGHPPFCCFLLLGKEGQV